MARPTGSSSLPTSSRNEEFYISAESPPVTQLGSVRLGPQDHILTPFLSRTPTDLHSSEPIRAGGELCGIEWISVGPWDPFDVEGKVRHRLVHNARPVLIKPLDATNECLRHIHVNDGVFLLQMPFPGLWVPPEGRYMPPGSLQIIVDHQELQIISAATTLPRPEQVATMPCSGWCRKQHLYTNFGMDEVAVVFFNRHGWPIACRENLLDVHLKRTSVRWWKFNYNRPDPEGGL